MIVMIIVEVGVGMLGEMFKPVRNVLLISCILFSVLLFDINNNYYHNVFQVTINDQEIYVQYYEQFRRILIPVLLDASGTVNDTSNNIRPTVNGIDYSTNMKLNIKEYSVYWPKHNERYTGYINWGFAKRLNYKEETLPRTNLVIKRKSQIIYDGDYIENISKYVNEPGRYFFKATVYRKDNFYTTIKTHMSFNIIVGGGNHE